MPAIARRSGPLRARQRCTAALARQRAWRWRQDAEDTAGDRPGRLATPGRRKGAGAPLMQDNPVQAAYHTDADQYCWPQQQPTRALAVTGISSVGPAKPHAVPCHIPKPQLHLSWSLRTTVCRQGPVLGRPQERPVKLSSTPPRCLRRWRPPCSASEPTCPSPGASPSLVRAVGALSSLRAPGGTATAVPVNAQRPASSARSLGRHRCEGQHRI
jgi:hypothetical protein